MAEQGVRRSHRGLLILLTRQGERAAEARTTAIEKGSVIISLRHDFVILFLIFWFPEADMNADGSKQHYVSTFKMRIKGPFASPAAQAGATDTRTSVTCTDAGKSCSGEKQRAACVFALGAKTTANIYLSYHLSRQV